MAREKTMTNTILTRRTKGATTRLTAPAYWKFESSPLQQTVRLSPDFASVPGKTRVFRHCAGRAGRQCRQRRAKPSNITPSSGGVSVGPYSSTAVLRVRFAISAALAASKVGCLGGSDLGGALSSDRLKQGRAGSVDLARRAADASAPAACLRSSRAAGARQEWLG